LRGRASGQSAAFGNQMRLIGITGFRGKHRHRLVRRSRQVQVPLIAEDAMERLRTIAEAFVKAPTQGSFAHGEGAP